MQNEGTSELGFLHHACIPFIIFLQNKHLIVLRLKLEICTWQIVLSAAVRVSCQKNKDGMTGLNRTDESNCST
jgi:hypothetical protein